MKATVEQQAKAWNTALWMAYIREVEVDGRREWALFDGDGFIVHQSENRSSAFFFAAEHEVTVLMLN